jgi:hypothetical protein
LIAGSRRRDQNGIASHAAGTQALVAGAQSMKQPGSVAMHTPGTPRMAAHSASLVQGAQLVRWLLQTVLPLTDVTQKQGPEDTGSMPQSLWALIGHVEDGAGQVPQDTGMPQSGWPTGQVRQASPVVQQVTAPSNWELTH